MLKSCVTAAGKAIGHFRLHFRFHMLVYMIFKIWAFSLFWKVSWCAVNSTGDYIYGQKMWFCGKTSNDNFTSHTSTNILSTWMNTLQGTSVCFEDNKEQESFLPLRQMDKQRHDNVTNTFSIPQVSLFKTECPPLDQKNQSSMNNEHWIVYILAHLWHNNLLKTQFYNKLNVTSKPHCKRIFWM